MANPDKVLGPGWRTSSDRAITTTGDVDGLNVMVADSATAYQWHTAATLSEPGYDTSEWIGRACMTGSGKRAVVVYAPRQFTNKSDAFDAGAFAAIVDLGTGAVRKLPIRVSLAYYSPGCGTGETVALASAHQEADKVSTTVSVADTSNGVVTLRATVPGQLTSVVPYGTGVAAALGGKLVSLDRAGKQTVLAAEAGVPFRIQPDAEGGLAYQVPAGKQVEIRRFAHGKSALLGKGALGAVQVEGSAGHVYLTGPDASKVDLDADSSKVMRKLNVPVDSEVSSTGALAVTLSTVASATEDPRSAGADASPAAVKPSDAVITVQATATATRTPVNFALTSQAVRPADGQASSPALGLADAPVTSSAPATPSASTTGMTAQGTQATNPATVPWDPDRGCAVPRNDPTIQTYQATAKQVEWAADLAVQGQLTPARGVNWEGSGMPVSWTPQGLFPLHQLSGGGQVPAQVLLGILAQESNTLQASPHAVDAVTGNFNQGGFYGDGSSWSTVDCGYGVGQVTTGMAVADGNTVYTANQQRAIATDYASNIAATVNILIDKWNQLKAAGIIANGGDPQYIENWWLAAWAYNSGVQPGSPAYGNTTGCTPGPNCTDAGGAGGNWGLGWSNNPANPKYPADRQMFNNSAADTKVPNHWSYPELVMGWASSPVPRYDYNHQSWGPAFTTGTWPGPAAAGEPPLNTFCTQTDDQCTPNGAQNVNGTMSSGLCYAIGLHCWWHAPVSWADCANVCGRQALAYTSSSSKPLANNIYPPDGCTTSTLPANAVIVDDVTTSGVACSGTPAWTSQGQFSLNFPAAMPTGCTSNCVEYPGKIDFHQLGVGFSGHIWFTHERDTPSVTGTWTPPTSVSGWTRIKVHVPDNGATTQQADYQINLGNGQFRHRLVNQHWSHNTWFDLGVFNLSTGASVSLSNANGHAPSGDGGDIAFDAVAFVPTVQPAAEYVAVGDSYSAGEGLEPYEPDADQPKDACHRSNQAYAYGVTLPGHTSPIAAESAANGAASFAFLACSSAETVSLTAAAADPNNTENTDWGDVNGDAFAHNELYQIDDSGYLDADTTLVTLSVGGNDARFTDIIQGCLMTFTDCTTSQYKLTRSDGKVDPAPLIQYEPYVISLLEGHLESVYKAIHDRAPQARIVVLGYPALFQANPGVCNGLMPVDQTWMNQMSVAMTQAISDAVGVVKQNDPAVDIKFVDPAPTFVGHAVCDSDEWINGIIAYSSSGSGSTFPLPGTGSFHPKAPGHQAEAALINSELG